MSEKKKMEHDELDSINEALSSSEQFVEKNQKTILTAVVGILVVATAIIAIRHYFIQPREDKALAEMFKGEIYFQADSFQVALKGNGADFAGFEAIASDLGSTKGGNLATAYAGICYYNLGEYDKALELLKGFDADDYLVSPNITAMVGDCYVNQGKYAESVALFEKAAKKADNIATSPIFLKKAGRVYEKLGEYDKAVAAYTSVKENYASSIDAMDIDKYIERAKAKK